MAETGFKVVGLRAFQRDLKKLADPRAGELSAALVLAGRAAAAPVADAARAAYPKKSGKLAGSVRVTGSRTGAAVRVGRKTVPYAAPVDFGGWPHGRPFFKDGRYLYPAMRDHRAAAAAIYERAVGAALDHYRWTNTGGNVHD